MKSKEGLVNVYYHKNCSDGFGSAWAAHKYFGDRAKYIPISHHDDVVVEEKINRTSTRGHDCIDSLKQIEWE